MHIPFHTPICIRGHTGKILQNELFSGHARCNGRNTQKREQLVLIPTDNGSVVVQSQSDRNYLQVQPSGKCIFAREKGTLFTVDSDESGHVYFTCCSTEIVMQCRNDGSAWCSNTNRQSWEAWTIVGPGKVTMIATGELRMVVAATVGAALVPVLGLLAGALVPVAMSTFGTVVPGVGSVHAPLVSCGCSAILQAISKRFVSTMAAGMGAAFGAVVME